MYGNITQAQADRTVVLKFPPLKSSAAELTHLRHCKKVTPQKHQDTTISKQYSGMRDLSALAAPGPSASPYAIGSTRAIVAAVPVIRKVRQDPADSGAAPAPN
jgi:hypothetical protein